MFIIINWIYETVCLEKELNWHLKQVSLNLIRQNNNKSNKILLKYLHLFNLFHKIFKQTNKQNLKLTSLQTTLDSFCYGSNICVTNAQKIIFGTGTKLTVETSKFAFLNQ